MGSTKESGLSFPSFRKIAEANGLEYNLIKNHKDINSRLFNILEKKHGSVTELIMDSEQEQIPKAVNKRDERGKTIQVPYEDLYPYLTENEKEDNLAFVNGTNHERN